MVQNTTHLTPFILCSIQHREERILNRHSEEYILNISYSTLLRYSFYVYTKPISTFISIIYIYIYIYIYICLYISKSKKI
jgi:hypothetical protein